MSRSHPRPRNLGALRASGYRYRTVKEELRENLQNRLIRGEPWLAGIVGYDETVLPQLERALLSKHDFILLGLRGQAKTRIIRQLVALLDPEIPVVEGAPILDDPLHPTTAWARRRIEEMGEATPIRWIDREERFHEKLATPDVTIADLIGDLDPIKAARERLDFSSEEAIHYGIIPRTNRGIFALNELPDLQPRIQVGLLNIMEENDIQIRGFPVRIPLDLVLTFTANPEDYTNRGNIITPLKDRIDSQILTHYPRSVDEAIAITHQEAWSERGEAIEVPRFLEEVLEEIAFTARGSDHVDQSSGVSQRLPIRARELLLSAVERRCLRTPEEPRVPRLCDLASVVPAVTGRIELVYEGEQEGPVIVAHRLIGKAMLKVFTRHFPPIYGRRRRRRAEAERAHGAGSEARERVTPPAYREILAYFSQGGKIELADAMSGEAYREELEKVPGLATLVERHLGKLAPAEKALASEWVLESLHEASLIARQNLDSGVRFSDVLANMFQEETER
ncbi:MAG: magnesium chelatase [Candidatus Eisenbacteria bacterium]|nr:magnesium chelatase [Candidatus Latescibacterota bacterium]MBD3301043.1 magnesium chelatase [Candidatus Eisenbacteria bacterium]